MIYLKDITKGAIAAEGFPFGVPAIESFTSLTILSPILFFVGANATGKSTFMESVAIASKRIVVGGKDLDVDDSLDAIRPLAKALRLSWIQRTSKGFFLRAEDFFNFARRNRELSSELQAYASKYDDDITVKGMFLGQKQQLERCYGDLAAVSHGESFLKVFQSRIVPGGLYLLDEPEAALSPQSQLAFLYQIKQAVDRGAQFIIATHSPILVSFPKAQIISFDHSAIKQVEYDDLDSVHLYRRFLENPKSYIDHLFRE